MSTPIQFFVLTYLDNAGIYKPSGLSVAISCNHQTCGLYGINMVGEIVPLPNATVPPFVTPGTDLQHGTAMIPQGTTLPPNYFDDANFKNVTKIKDMETLREYYVDTADYATKVIACNPIPYVTACASVTSLSAGTPGATSATITWVKVIGSVGIEWINKTVDVTPVLDGQFVDVNTQSTLVPGLTTATNYFFFIRTICQGLKSSWTRVAYTTA